MSENTYSKLTSKVDGLEVKINAILETLKKADETRSNNASIIDNNFQVLDSKIDALHKDTKDGFKEVKFELVKIQKTTDYEQLYENMKVVGDE